MQFHSGKNIEVSALVLPQKWEKGRRRREEKPRVLPMNLKHPVPLPAALMRSVLNLEEPRSGKINKERKKKSHSKCFLNDNKKIRNGNAHGKGGSWRRLGFFWWGKRELLVRTSTRRSRGMGEGTIWNYLL